MNDWQKLHELAKKMDKGAEYPRTGEETLARVLLLIETQLRERDQKICEMAEWVASLQDRLEELEGERRWRS